ncbi:MAG: T9SS type A sorting domain-containing protein [Bacteroidia bacterium]
MKKIYKHLLFTLLLASISSLSANAQCSVAGTATATEDSICDNGTTTLQLAGYTGAIQWQSYNGTSWVNLVGAGVTTDSCIINVAATTDYRALVTETACLPDSSNILTVVTGSIPVPVVIGDTVCGYGIVDLQASGAVDYNWYNDSSGGNVIANGTTYSPTVAATTTYYVEALSGGGTAAPLTTTFAGGNGFDGNMFDIEAINQVTITSFDCNCTASTAYAEIWYRPGSYVGHNLDSIGWTQIDSVQMTSTGNGFGTPVPININVTIPAGQVYGFYFHFAGSVDYTDGTAVGNVAAQDANIIVKEGHGGAYFNLTNSPRIWNGTVYYTAGCTSARVPVTATVTIADEVAISASDSALCLGTSATLDVTSANVNYTYTWSPATGLNATTGSSVIATPLVPTTYTVIGSDGTCADIESVYINVGPASVAGTASSGGDTICLGSTVTLILTGSIGTIQWQGYDGVNWVNETSPGFDSTVYEVSPSQFTQYRAIVVSGGCAPDTSVTLSIEVVSITDPTATGDTICGPGIASLTASGVGSLQWFADTLSFTALGSGSSFNPSITGTTTFYVESSAGSIYNVGAINPGIGSQATSPASDYGLQFDCNKQCVLKRVYISPSQTGSITINLRASQGGPVLQSFTTNVQAFTGTQPADVDFNLSPGIGYRLELENGSVQLYRNSNGAAYPYTVPGSPVTITGYVNPNFATGTLYYWFYNWLIDDGCQSNRIPVTAEVLPLPAVPVITQNGAVLNSSSPLPCQWYYNGVLIPGATTQSITISQLGDYTVTVTDVNGCSSTSSIFTVTAIGIKEIAGNSIAVYPNPSAGDFILKLASPLSKESEIKITDAYGRVVFAQTVAAGKSEIKFDLQLSDGYYMLQLNNADGVLRQKIEIIE